MNNVLSVVEKLEKMKVQEVSIKDQKKIIAGDPLVNGSLQSIVLSIIKIKGAIDEEDETIEVESGLFNDDSLCLSLCKKHQSTLVFNLIQEKNPNFFIKKHNVVEVLKNNYLPLLLVMRVLDEEVAALLIKRCVKVEKEINDSAGKHRDRGYLKFIHNLPNEYIVDENFVMSIRDELPYLREYYSSFNRVQMMSNILNTIQEKEEREKYLNSEFNNIDKALIEKKKNKI